MADRAYVWEARIALPDGTEPATVGAAVTAELCGHWAHDPPCRWPHNNEFVGDAFRTLYVAGEAEEPAVRARIERAVRRAAAAVESGPREVLPEERELADSLAALARRPPGVEARRLDTGELDEQLDALADVLVDSVEGGASVGYLVPFSHDEARGAYAAWAADAAAGHRIVFGAFDGDSLVGSVQLAFSSYPNGRYRAELVKLLVLRSERGRGIGRVLMERAEAEAVLAGKTLLHLDTATDEAERLYLRLGWTRTGAIPDYALMPDGSPCDTVIYWKKLAQPGLTTGDTPRTWFKREPGS